MKKAYVSSLLMGVCLMGCGLMGCRDDSATLVAHAPEQELTGSDRDAARHGFNGAMRSARLANIAVEGMTDGLSPGSKLNLALPGAGQAVLVVQTVRELLPGVTTFSGHLADDETSDFTLSIEAGKLVGSIRQGTYAWLVEPHPSSDQHLIRTIDRTMLPKDEPALGHPQQQALSEAPRSMDQPQPTSVVTSTGNVRVLFLNANNVTNASAHAANIVTAFNNSLSLSEVDANNYLTIADVQQVESNFNGQTREEILNKMRDRAAPFTGINTAMANTAADIAFLLVQEDTTASEAYPFGRVGGAAFKFEQDNPFALSTDDYALGDLSALHEIGHVFGGDHENVASAGIARPVVAPDGKWMTVMGGYFAPCHFNGLPTPDHPALCVRLNRWSNPDQMYEGIPLGVAGQSDMESHLESSMPMVSGWRAAPSPPPSPANINSPAPGSMLANSTVTFSWTAGSGVSQYFLYVGSSVGAGDIYAVDQGLARSATVSGLPLDGRTIFVRLWSLIGAEWQFVDYTYTVANLVTPGQISSPAAGSTLSGSTVTFTWTPGTDVSRYDLYVGSSLGANDLYVANHGTATSGTVSGLPMDGRTIFVRLWSLTSAGWLFRDRTYTAAPTLAQITSPAPSSQLAGSTVTFSWTTGGGVTYYDLLIGSSLGAADIYNANDGTATSVTVSGLPTDGRTLFVRLWSWTSLGWLYRDFTYTASGVVCDSRNGMHGQMWITEGTHSQYMYNAGWCGVGTSLPAGCYLGSYYYYQSLASNYCSSTGSSGSCYSSDAWWWVSCNSLVDCTYNCSGQCVRSSC